MLSLRVCPQRQCRSERPMAVGPDKWGSGGGKEEKEWFGWGKEVKWRRERGEREGNAAFTSERCRSSLRSR